jgi:hypothetical protein
MKYAKIKEEARWANFFITKKIKLNTTLWIFLVFYKQSGHTHP